MPHHKPHFKGSMFGMSTHEQHAQGSHVSGLFFVGHAPDGRAIKVELKNTKHGGDTVTVTRITNTDQPHETKEETLLSCDI